MSTTPPTISPRSRSREPIGSPSPASSTPAASSSKLRVLIRLPQVVPESNVSTRFKFAVGLLATLKRSYAAAAFALFLVGMVLILLHGKSPAPAQNDIESDAPRWNNAVRAPAGQPAPTGPTLHSYDGQPRAGVPLAQPSAPQFSAEVPRYQAAAAPSPVAPFDRIPQQMPLTNPSHNGLADRRPPWQAQSPGPAGNPAARNYR